MGHCHRSLVLVVAFFLLFGAAADAAPPSVVPTVVVLPFQLIDTSLQGEIEGSTASERARLTMITRQLRDLLAASGRYQLFPLGPAAEAAEAINLTGCPGCDVALGRDLDADLVVSGTVQKVSNLILNINIAVREVAGGALIKAASADIRGNTDESWSRGISWLVRHHRLLADPR